MVSQPVVVWSAIVLLMLVAFVVRAIVKLRMSLHFSNSKHHFVEMAKEKEIFYCPGDEWYDECINE